MYAIYSRNTEQTAHAPNTHVGRADSLDAALDKASAWLLSPTRPRSTWGEDRVYVSLSCEANGWNPSVQTVLALRDEGDYLGEHVVHYDPTLLALVEEMS